MTEPTRVRLIVEGELVRDPSSGVTKLLIRQDGYDLNAAVRITPAGLAHCRIELLTGGA